MSPKYSLKYSKTSHPYTLNWQLQTGNMETVFCNFPLQDSHPFPFHSLHLSLSFVRSSSSPCSLSLFSLCPCLHYDVHPLTPAWQMGENTAPSIKLNPSQRGVNFEVSSTARLAVYLVPWLSYIQILCISFSISLFCPPVSFQGSLLVISSCECFFYFFFYSRPEIVCVRVCVCKCRYRLPGSTGGPDVKWHVERPSLWTLAEGGKRNQIKTDIAFV